MKISGQVVDLLRREISGGDIYIREGRIDAVVQNEKAPDQYILPGFIDSHVHIESSMVTPSQFAAVAVRHGTVAVVSDPHEIANVLGLKGVEYMIEDASKSFLSFTFGAPSCVPATPFETSGAVIDAKDTAELLKNSSIGYLAEMMNFPGVIFNDTEVMAKIEAAKSVSKPIDGHAPGLTGENLRKYIGAGISTDHECSTLEEALEKIGLGMKILIREGSAARNLDSLKELMRLYPDKVMICCDDIHPEMLVKGHINVIAARLISEGYDIFDVLRAVSLNPVKHYGLESGLLQVGDKADFIITDDLKKLKINQTWINGNRVFCHDEKPLKVQQAAIINNFNATPIDTESIKVKKEGGYFRVIKAFNGELLTKSMTVPSGNNSYIENNTDKDIIKIVVKDRYKDAPPVVGFVNGFALKHGAFATSVAHDSHNIIAAGADDKLIVEAINMVIATSGGMAVVDDSMNEILPLPVAGIMSDSPAYQVAEQYERLTKMVKNMGCPMDAPFMTLSFMALLVIPELKIGDKGLFDVSSFNPVNLFID